MLMKHRVSHSCCQRFESLVRSWHRHLMVYQGVSRCGRQCFRKHSPMCSSGNYFQNRRSGNYFRTSRMTWGGSGRGRHVKVNIGRKLWWNRELAFSFAFCRRRNKQGLEFERRVPRPLYFSTPVRLFERLAPTTPSV